MDLCDVYVHFIFKFHMLSGRRFYNRYMYNAIEADNYNAHQTLKTILHFFFVIQLP